MRTGTTVINRAAMFGRGTKRRNNLGGFTSLGAIDVQVLALDRKVNELKDSLLRDDLTPTQRHAKGALLQRAEVRKASMVQAFIERGLKVYKD